MIKKIFSIYDSKAEFYTFPVSFHTKAEAIRTFAELVQDGKSQISKYPSDYTLFEIGEYDDSSCKFKLHTTLIPLGLAVEYVSKLESVS